MSDFINSLLTECKPYIDLLAVLSNIATVAASVLALSVYYKNRTKISAAIQLLINYSFQTTLSELKEKLERLNAYNAGNASDVPEIRNILLEIAGQMRGNKVINENMCDLINKFERLARTKSLLEQHKRSLVSEARESLRYMQVNSLDLEMRDE